MPPVNHQQKCLINGICNTFRIKSNYFCPVIPRSHAKFMGYTRPVQMGYGLRTFLHITMGEAENVYAGQILFSFISCILH